MVGWIFGPFWTVLVHFLAQNFAHSGLHYGIHFDPLFGSKMAPLRGGVLSGSTRNSMGFEGFRPPNGAPFWDPFWAQFLLDSGCHFWSNFGFFWVPLMGQPETPIGQGPGAGLAGPWGRG